MALLMQSMLLHPDLFAPLIKDSQYPRARICYELGRDAFGFQEDHMPEQYDILKQRLDRAVGAVSQ